MIIPFENHVKEELEKAVFTYLSNDMVSVEGFKDPFDTNSKYFHNLKKDAKGLANLSLTIIKQTTVSNHVLEEVDIEDVILAFEFLLGHLDPGELTDKLNAFVNRFKSTEDQEKPNKVEIFFRLS